MNSIGFFVGKFLPWLVFWFVLRVVFGIGVWQAGLVADLGVAFVVDWVFLVDKMAGNEKGRYWLSMDIFELVGNLAM